MGSFFKAASGSQRLALALCVAAATTLVFWGAAHNGFINYDDSVFLSPPFRGLGAGSLRRMFTSFYDCNYAPLSMLSLSVDFALCGLAPFGYHLSNILLHAANAALFFLLCLELLTPAAARDDAQPAAVAAALFFAWHPLRVQSVAWVAERRDVLCGFFFLLTLWLWLRSLRPGWWHGARGQAAALSSFLLALLAKSAATPLPLVLILLDIWPLRRLPASPRRWGATPSVWKEKLPFLALAAAFAGLAIAAQSEGGAIMGWAESRPWDRAYQIGAGLVFYLGKLLWPAELGFYGWQWPPVRAAVWAGAVATATLLILAAWSRRLRAPLLAALAYQTLLLAPVLGFVKIGHELVAVRYSYLSGLAWAALFGAGVREFARRRRAVAVAVSCLLLGALAAATRAELPYWRDSASLWRRELRVDPLSWMARPNLAEALISKGRLGEAILYLEEHLRLYPQDAPARRVLEDIVRRTGTTIRDHARFHEQIGLEFASRGEFTKAAWHFERGLKYEPSSTRLHAELAQARLGQRGTL